MITKIAFLTVILGIGFMIQVSQQQGFNGDCIPWWYRANPDVGYTDAECQRRASNTGARWMVYPKGEFLEDELVKKRSKVFLCQYILIKGRVTSMKK